MVLASFLIAFSIMLALGLLGGFHMYLSLSNQTTIEFYGNFALRSKAKKEGRKWSNPYGKGIHGNFREVFRYPIWNLRWMFPWVAAIEKCLFRRPSGAVHTM